MGHGQATQGVTGMVKISTFTAEKACVLNTITTAGNWFHSFIQNPDEYLTDPVMRSPLEKYFRGHKRSFCIFVLPYIRDIRTGDF